MEKDEYTCGDCDHFEKMSRPMFFGARGDTKRDGKCLWGVGMGLYILSTNPECLPRTSERELKEERDQYREWIERELNCNHECEGCSETTCPLR